MEDAVLRRFLEERGWVENRESIDAKEVMKRRFLACRTIGEVRRRIRFLLDQIDEKTVKDWGRPWQDLAKEKWPVLEEATAAIERRPSLDLADAELEEAIAERNGEVEEEAAKHEAAAIEDEDAAESEEEEREKADFEEEEDAEESGFS
jgi:hypothetical protein